MGDGISFPLFCSTAVVVWVGGLGRGGFGFLGYPKMKGIVAYGYP